MIHSCECYFLFIYFFDSCSRVPCLCSKTACCSSEKYFRSFFGFQAFLCIWTLSNNDCMILRSIFSHWGQLRDLYATIAQGSNAHWCFRRKTRCIKSFSLIFPKYHIFSSFSTALQKLQKTFKCFPEDKIITFTLIFKFKKFSPLALNAWFSLLEHSVNLLW